MSAKILLAALWMASAAVPAADARRFAPPECDYGVVFPELPVAEGAAPAGGRRTTVARLAEEDLVLMASCTTGYPDGVLPAMPDDRILAFVEGLTRRMRIRQPRIRLAHGPHGRSVEISGERGEGESRTYLQTRIYYGPKSRLIVEAASSRNGDAETYISTFFDSVFLNRN